MQRTGLALLALVAACGGGSAQTPVAAPPPAGDAHATPPPPAAPASPVAPDVAPPAPGEPVASDPAHAIAPPEEKLAPRSLPPPKETIIELKNEGEGDLMFSTTRGWQPIIFAYTGKPPKAKSVMLFESFCTASCDAAGDAVCPVCAQPKTKKEELAMAKTETAAPGNAVKVAWDGKVLVYEPAPGKKKCKCWRKVDPPPDTYTIKACGLRPAKDAGKASRPVCAETEVTIGVGELWRTIFLVFPK